MRASALPKCFHEYLSNIHKNIVEVRVPCVTLELCNRVLPAEVVPWVVTFPYADSGKAVMDSLCSLLGGAWTSKPGDSCPAEEDAPVQVVYSDIYSRG